MINSAENLRTADFFHPATSAVAVHFSFESFWGSWWTMKERWVEWCCFTFVMGSLSEPRFWSQIVPLEMFDVHLRKAACAASSCGMLQQPGRSLGASWCHAGFPKLQVFGLLGYQITRWSGLVSHLSQVTRRLLHTDEWRTSPHLVSTKYMGWPARYRSTSGCP